MEQEKLEEQTFDLSRRRTNLKKILAATLSLALAVSVFAGCGASSGSAGTSEESAAAQTEEASASDLPEDTGAKDEEQFINTFITADPSTLDCARFLGIVDRTILHNITEPLTRIENGTVTAAGAQSWEISEDGISYTFHLRENHWDDGTPVTASDYVYALTREADPANAWSFASDFFSVAGFEAVYNGEAGAETLGVKAEDDQTLVITLTAANPAFLSTVDIFPCRQSDVEAYGDTYGSEAGKISSCGPFKLDAWVHNSSLAFTKNENYWDADNVALSKFTEAVINDESAQMNSLENGSIDYASVLAEEYVAKFGARDDLYEIDMDSDRTYMLVFNCEDETFANTKIRQAFSLALDRDLLIAITNGGLGTPAYGLVPPVCYVGDTNYREVTQEPLSELTASVTDPKALLIEGMKEAGLGEDPSALTVSFTYGNTSASGRTYAELYQQMWQETLGVNVEIDFNESAMATIREGNYQIGSVGWGSTYEPVFQLSRWSTGGQSRWMNEEYAALVAEGSTSMDDAVRLDKYQQAEKLLVTEAAIAPTIYNATRTFAYDYVGGIPTNPFDTTGMKTYYTSGRD